MTLVSKIFIDATSTCNSSVAAGGIFGNQSKKSSGEGVKEEAFVKRERFKIG